MMGYDNFLSALRLTIARSFRSCRDTWDAGSWQSPTTTRFMSAWKALPCYLSADRQLIVAEAEVLRHATFSAFNSNVASPR